MKKLKNTLTISLVSLVSIGTAQASDYSLGFSNMSIDQLKERAKGARSRDASMIQQELQDRAQNDYKLIARPWQMNPHISPKKLSEHIQKSITTDTNDRLANILQRLPRRNIDYTVQKAIELVAPNAFARPRGQYYNVR